MTLAVAIEGANGIVLAADSRATFGDPRGLTAVNDTVNKIFKPTPRIAVAMAGQADTGNSLMQHIAAGLSPIPGANVDQVADVMRTVGNQFFTQWFGAPTWLIGGNGPVAAPRPDVWYILAGYAQNGQPKIVSLGSTLPFNFAPNLSTTGFAVIGIVPLAVYLLNRLYSRGLDLDIAKDLAAYCILETASQDGKVGGPIRMAIVRPNADTELMSDDEIADLEKRVSAHREALRSSFLNLEKEQRRTADAPPSAPALTPA